jgi:hypothetical protein
VLEDVPSRTVVARRDRPHSSAHSPPLRRKSSGYLGEDISGDDRCHPTQGRHQTRRGSHQQNLLEQYIVYRLEVRDVVRDTEVALEHHEALTRRRRNPHRGLGRCETIKGAADVVVITHPVVVDPVDECTPMRLDRNQTFAVKSHQRPPHGNATHAESMGDIFLPYTISPPQRSGDDLRTYATRHLPTR